MMNIMHVTDTSAASAVKPCWRPPPARGGSAASSLVRQAFDLRLLVRLEVCENASLETVSAFARRWFICD